MTDQLNEILRTMSGALERLDQKLDSGLKAHGEKIDELVRMQLRSDEGREKMRDEIHTIREQQIKQDNRLDMLETKVSGIEVARESEAPLRAKIAAWLTAGSVVLGVVLAAITGLIPQWLKEVFR